MFKLEFETDNDAFAFQLREEIVRILESVAHQVEDTLLGYGGLNKIKDINGNTVGRWEFTP